VVVAEAAEASCGFEVVAFLETTEGDSANVGFEGRPILRGFDAARAYLQQGVRLVVAVGANEHRCRLAREATERGFERATVIHPMASVSRTAKIGVGSVVLAGAVVAPRAVLGEDVIVNHGATVDHDCVLESGVHLSPGVHLGGHVRVGEEAWLGAGAAVRDRVCIGSRAIVGVGAAVVNDLPPGVVAYGVPAKERGGR
jgi:sugar O-acyltransferase (sialic acid O-acetyltransferase NeuD family)